MEYLVLNNNTIAPACITYIGDGTEDPCPRYVKPCTYTPCFTKPCNPIHGPIQPDTIL